MASAQNTIGRNLPRGSKTTSVTSPFTTSITNPSAGIYGGMAALKRVYKNGVPDLSHITRESIENRPEAAWNNWTMSPEMRARQDAANAARDERIRTFGWGRPTDTEAPSPTSATPPGYQPTLGVTQPSGPQAAWGNNTGVQGVLNRPALQPPAPAVQSYIAAFGPDGKPIYANDGGNYTVFDIGTGQNVKSNTPEGRIALENQKRYNAFQQYAKTEEGRKALRSQAEIKMANELYSWQLSLARFGKNVDTFQKINKERSLRSKYGLDVPINEWTPSSASDSWKTWTGYEDWIKNNPT